MIHAVKALVVKDNKYLFVKRAADSSFFPGLWDLPGGKVEPGEELGKALAREVREETGLSIEPNKTMQEFLVTEKATDIKLTVFSTKLFPGKVKLSKDHSAFAWLSKEELKGRASEVTPVVKYYFLL